MKSYLYTVLDLGWTLLYFLYWGGCYGAVLGSLTGTIVLYPILGTFLGAFLGLFIGGAVGFGVALVVIPIFLLSYSPQITNPERYSRRLALLAAMSVSVMTLLLTIWGMRLDIKEGWKPLLIASIGIGGFWATLAAAYVTRLYPYHVAHLHETPIASHTSDNPFQLATQSLTRHFSLVWLLCLTAFGAIALYMRFQEAQRLPIYFIVAGLSLWISPTYTLFGNALLINFLRLLLFEDYLPYLSPYTVRLSLTLISFFSTCIFVWWIWLIIPVGVPLVAFYTAYYVYHTLALPEEVNRLQARGRDIV